jgi:Putative MetA-pathway of phenol degradation
MGRKSLLIAMLLAVASPLAAQEEMVWSSKRPDAQPPIGVNVGRLLDAGQFQLTYRFTQMDSRGVWIQHDSLTVDQTLDFYPVAPLTLANMTHEVVVAYGLSDNLTLTGNIGYSKRRREQLTESGVFYVTDANELGDLQVTALYKAFEQGPYRAHLQLGALIPTGASEVRAETPFSTPNKESLPYDMRPGAGTFAAEPGMTVEAQNEFGTVGLQFTGILRFGTNSQDYGLGNLYDGNFWAGYRINEFLSISARAHYMKWGGIEGADPSLDATRDPGNAAYFLSGERLDVPVGLNLYMPEGSRFAGNRLALEFIFPAHQQYDAPQLGASWGIVAGWQVVF